MSSRPFSVALTGGIASGKSALAERFATLGAAIVDADLIAREVVAPGQPALAEIVAAFGPGVLDAHGRLDRRALRARVFDDPDERRRLEGIILPRVRSVLRQRVADIRAPYAMPVVPLLYEHRADYAWVDRVLVVDVPRAVQRARLIARDRSTPELADRILDAQASREERLSFADDVIDNTGSLAELDAAVRALHRRYLALAAT